MTEMTPDNQLLASDLFDIFQLFADARNSATVSYRQDEISSLIDLVTAACHRAEETASRYYDVANTFPVFEGLPWDDALDEIWDDLHIPKGLEWTSVGTDLTAICPTVLRTGSYHDRCKLPDAGGFLLRALVWRYLATRLAMLRTSQKIKGYHPLFSLDAVRRSLIHTAKTQREMLDTILMADTNVAGDMTALAVSQHAAASFNSYLVTVSELSGGDKDAFKLTSRAKFALNNVKNPEINHKVIMSDDIPSAFEYGDSYCWGDQPIHLVGNPDEVRFVFVVSGVPDNDDRPPSDEIYEGRFRLSKSGLRDAFAGLPSDEARFYGGLEFYRAAYQTISIDPMYPDRSVLHSAADKLGLDYHAPEAVKNDSLISRSKVAREFFGYKGLAELDPQ